MQVKKSKAALGGIVTLCAAQAAWWLLMGVALRDAWV